MFLLVHQRLLVHTDSLASDVTESVKRIVGSLWYVPSRSDETRVQAVMQDTPRVASL
jgi:hypothetical protein